MQWRKQPRVSPNDSRLSVRLWRQAARSEQVKREGWREQGLLAISADDRRLTWPERELISSVSWVKSSMALARAKRSRVRRNMNGPPSASRFMSMVESIVNVVVGYGVAVVT